MADRIFTADMAEISGLGDGHEAPVEYSGWDETTCRAMVLAGCTWFDGNKDQDGFPPDPVFGELCGMVVPVNADGKGLMDAMVSPTLGLDVPMAVFRQCLGHVFAIQQKGWDEYCRIMREAKRLMATRQTAEKVLNGGGHCGTPE